MKIGTQTGSLVNHMLTVNAQESMEIVVGMGATVCGWTDRHACTVTAWDGKVLTVREDDAVRADANGMSDAQQYVYTTNPNAPERTFKRNRKGQWLPCIRNERGRWVLCGSNTLILGTRQKFHDFSF